MKQKRYIIDLILGMTVMIIFLYALSYINIFSSGVLYRVSLIFVIWTVSGFLLFLLTGGLTKHVRHWKVVKTKLISILESILFIMLFYAMWKYWVLDEIYFQIAFYMIIFSLAFGLFIDYLKDIYVGISS